MSLQLVQGDVGVNLRGSLINDDTAGPLDITGCHVFFQMREKNDNRYTINAECTILDHPGGLVRYTTAANDLNRTGNYLAQFEVNYPGGEILTTKDWIEIIVRRQ